MTPKQCISNVIMPALALLPGRMTSQVALVQLLAITMQESGPAIERRRQLGNGPARGLWQFEISGCQGVLEYHTTRTLAMAVCESRAVAPEPEAVLAAVEVDDILAAAFSRLYLWTDPHPMPALGDQQGAWDLYLRTWRPGRPRPEHWPENYSAALSAIEH